MNRNSPSKGDLIRHLYCFKNLLALVWCDQRSINDLNLNEETIDSDIRRVNCEACLAKKN